MIPASALHQLDNIAWHTLTGPHARFASGSGDARRYAQGYPPIVGFRDPERPDFAALLPWCEPGEHVYCGGWSGPEPAGWRIEADALMYQMVWDAGMPARDEVPEAVRLGPAHVDEVLALIDIALPGPFGPRNVDLGEYFGVFEDGQLVAMAGERLCAGALREISAVATRPEHRGRGHAQRLMRKLIRREMQRGEIPFLHVLKDNAGAHALYLKMGFRNHAELPVRVLVRT